MSKHVIVLGGGACGLAAAWELIERGHKVTVIERAPLVGGLAGCVEHNGNRYEYGTHVFHTDQPDLRKRVLDLMGDRMFSFDRGSRLEIKFRDKYFPFPLNGIQVIRNLPIHLSAECVLSLIKWILIAQISHRGPATTEEYLKWHFGAKLYDIFFKDYTLKFWGVPCSQLDPKFGQDRIPRSDVFRILHDLIDYLGLQKVINRHPLVERSIGKLYYTPTGLQAMFQRIADHVVNKGGTVLTSTHAKQVCTSNGRFESVCVSGPDGERVIDGDCLVSTIPLPWLVRMIPSAPSHVVASAGELKFLPLTVCGLLVRRKPVRTAICTYYRDKIFNRLSEPTNHNLLVEPSNASLLLAEMTPYSLGSSADNPEAIRDAVIKDIVQEGLIKSEDVLDSIVFNYDSAYPIYLLGYQEHLARCLDYISSLDSIRTVGRQGQFIYVNIHVTMRKGLEIARELSANI